MSKTLNLTLYSHEDEWGETTREELAGTTDFGESIHYFVCDLWECPEDATLNRDLFSAWEYIDVLRLGMQLAQNGYTDIEVDLQGD